MRSGAAEAETETETEAEAETDPGFPGRVEVRGPS